MINAVALRFAHNKNARLVGIRVYCPSYLHDMTQASLKLFLESYFDLAICSLLNLMAFIEYNDEFSDFFSSFDDTLCSVFTIVYSILIFMTPLAAFYIIKTKLRFLHYRDTRSKFGVLYSDSKTSTLA